MVLPSITLPGVNTTGNQNTTGNADSATVLATPRTIGGVSFDGSANIDLPGVNVAGNQNTSGNAASATVLATARTIGGVSFNGSTDIDLPGVNTQVIKIQPVMQQLHPMHPTSVETLVHTT